MEDAHICAAKLDVSSSEDLAFFGVFDGHGGSEVAQFCAKYMSRELLRSEDFRFKDYDKALKSVFHQMDKLLCDPLHAKELLLVSCTVSSYGSNDNPCYMCR